MPEEEIAYLLRGHIYGMSHQWEAAQADFEQVLALNPFNEEAQLRIGQLMSEQGKLDEALAYFGVLPRCGAIHLPPTFFSLNSPAKYVLS